MARQVNITLSDTINGWRQKTNLTATYVGDLDNLIAGISTDSNIVAALNTMYIIRRSYTAGLGISKSTGTDSSGVFNVAGGHGLTQEAGGLKLEDMPANTIKVRDAASAGASSNKAVTNKQILIGDGTGFTSAALSQDVLMTNSGIVTIQPDVVTYAKMQNVVGANKVLGSSTANGIITETQVQTGMIADDAVTTVKILDDNVTYAKIQDANANSILVRDGAAAGDISAKTLTDTQILINNGAGFTAAALSGDVTMSNAGVVTVDPSVIGTVRLGGTAPATPSNGTAWFDDVTAGEMFVYSASAGNWIQVTGSITSFSAISGTPPAAPLDGTFWFDDGATGELFIYSNDASNWIQVTGVVANVAFSDLTSTPTTLAGYGITDALALGTTGTTALAGNSVLTDLSITDGTSGQVLTTDGSGGFTFASASSSTTLGAVGTHAFLMRTSTAQNDYISVGSSYAGSSLTYAGVSRSAGNNIIISPSGSPGGTWKAMGHVGSAFGGFNQRATLFVRIS